MSLAAESLTGLLAAHLALDAPLQVLLGVDASRTAPRG
jgi:hypothetical protein